jgi:molybdopterin-guanine dinucleotide biosynthesis protein B
LKIFGIAGWSGSGKTTLVERLLPELVRRGFTVSTVKHAHHAFDVDRPGKDSWRHREAGASEVLVISGRRWALMHENRDEPEPPIEALLDRLSPVDLLLIEGFKHHPHPKLEVWRRAAGKGLLAPDDRDILAVAADADLPGLAVPRLDLDDIPAIADFILDRCGLPRSR